MADGPRIPDLDEAASRQAFGSASSVRHDDCGGTDVEVRSREDACTDRAPPRPTLREKRRTIQSP